MSKQGMRILTEVGWERVSQNDKWGEQNHSPIEWMAILTEEVGEASKEAVDYHFKNPIKFTEGTMLNMEVLKESTQETRLRLYRKELIQVAAVAVQMIESLDRNELK